MHEILSKARKRGESGHNVYECLYFSKDTNRRYYKHLTSNEIVVVMFDDRKMEKEIKNIVFWWKRAVLKQIHEYHYINLLFHDVILFF